MGFEYELIATIPWARREAFASRYRNGRVFIAGDAAHQTSPTGGLGYHTGIQDAVDLAWKLAAVLHGWGGERLLDSYEIERKPIARENLRVSTREFEFLVNLPTGPEIAEDSANGAALRQRWAEAFARVPWHARHGESAPRVLLRRIPDCRGRRHHPSADRCDRVHSVGAPRYAGAARVAR